MVMGVPSSRSGPALKLEAASLTTGSGGVLFPARHRWIGAMMAGVLKTQIAASLPMQR